MGQIEEDIIDGTCCALCTCYFVNPKDDNATYTHGYPVACHDCWDEDCGYPKAMAKTF